MIKYLCIIEENISPLKGVYHDDVLVSVFDLSQQPNCLEIYLGSLKIVWQISSET